MSNWKYPGNSDRKNDNVKAYTIKARKEYNTYGDVNTIIPTVEYKQRKNFY